jgi:hypothetical protein
VALALWRYNMIVIGIILMVGIYMIPLLIYRHMHGTPFWDSRPNWMQANDPRVNRKLWNQGKKLKNDIEAGLIPFSEWKKFTRNVYFHRNMLCPTKEIADAAWKKNHPVKGGSRSDDK